MANVRARLSISGRVQGVFYRATCRGEALARGLTGWVRNSSDGIVEAILEGPQDKVEDMIKWCYKGPPGAMVSDIKISWEPSKGDQKDFKIT